MAAAAAATQLPPELWNKVLVEYCDASNRSVGRLAQTCTALRNTILEDDGIWRTLFQRRFGAHATVTAPPNPHNSTELMIPARTSRIASSTSTSGTADALRGCGTAPSGACSINTFRDHYVALHDLERRFRKGLWDRKLKLATHPTPVCDVHLNPGTRDVCIALGSGEIVCMRGRDVLSRKHAVSPAVRCFVAPGEVLYAGLQNGDILIGDDFSLQKAHAGKVCGLEKCVGAGEESLLFSCSPADDCVKLWDLNASNARDPVMVWRHDSASTLSVVSGVDVWTGGSDRMLNRWDAREMGSGRPVQSFGPADDWVMMVEAGSGNMVRAADKAIHLWDPRYPKSAVLSTHRHQKLITRFHSMMTRKTCAPRLVSCSLDGRVKISSLDRYRDDVSYNTTARRKLSTVVGEGAADEVVGNVDGALSRTRSGIVTLNPSTRRTDAGFDMDAISSGAHAHFENASYNFMEASLVHSEATTLPCSNDYVLCVDFDDTKLLVGGVDGTLFEYDFERSFVPPARPRTRASSSTGTPTKSSGPPHSTSGFVGGGGGGGGGNAPAITSSVVLGARGAETVGRGRAQTEGDGDGVLRFAGLDWLPVTKIHDATSGSGSPGVAATSQESDARVRSPGISESPKTKAARNSLEEKFTAMSDNGLRLGLAAGAAAAPPKSSAELFRRSKSRSAEGANEYASCPSSSSDDEPLQVRGPKSNGAKRDGAHGEQAESSAKSSTKKQKKHPSLEMLSSEDDGSSTDEQEELMRCSREPSSEFLYGLARQQHLKELGNRLMSVESHGL
mmetsp:Transcript_10618/g.25945  ORF Transcript_10618/g.25945 Transcript_10618/m.25945 type:complete len:788 (+) Transcript_10618:311-2674(+)|eukprot:CAMPEP_0178998876 /NCGR_PEP_ID=MMETSP0795-20121207/9744_1 /TAXON_ID=88552 /ORGANISM="Amoebophrya sp., Strain Ameob2" /LENGTH=787 /DNA_ID=CAMNT_0020691579 /DNA_START=240 /DNA_END=2603 /DNA_ORIENTATION=-